MERTVFRFILCGIIGLGASAGSVAAQAAYGIDQRVPNTSLLISLQNGAPPRTIAASGLYSDINARVLAPGLIPYQVNSELWSDGADKERFLALPGAAQIVFSREDPWILPDDAVVVKNFYLAFIRNDASTRQLVETRFLVKNGGTGQWEGFSYMWNEAGTDAELLDDSAVLDFIVLDDSHPDGFEVQQHFYPGPQDCKLCHTSPAGDVLGVNTAQLNRDYDYGNVTDNQLRTWNHIGLFTEDIGESFAAFPRWSDPRDEGEPLERRVRSYLAANCSHCHRPGVVDKATIDLRFEVELAQTNTVGQLPFLGRIGSDDPEIINPGDPDNSTLMLRLLDFSSTRMPPIASSRVDTQAVGLLRRWISQLNPITAVETEDDGQPDAVSLAPNYPNPFNAGTTIGFALDRGGEMALDIYNTAGQRVRQLLQGRLDAGRYRVQWDGRTDSGEAAASGTYVYRLQAGGTIQSRPLTLIK